MKARPGAEVPAVVRRIDEQGARERSDVVATEEPLSIRLGDHTIAVTMRTPGSDFELVAGFLYGEGVIHAHRDIHELRYCTDDEQLYNDVTADLTVEAPEVGERNFFTTSACGVCGRTSIDALRSLGGPPLGEGPTVEPEVLRSLPERLRAEQRVFSRTGGLHASAAFTPEGELVCLREDVGRHNAMDKLVGWALLQDRLPLADRIVLVSGRASFEIMQKARRAGAAFVAAVGAPSSLAVEVAEDFGMTLVGFLKPDGFNVYAGAERVGG